MLKDAPAIQGIALLPPLDAGKYVRLRSVEGSRQVELDYVVSVQEGYTIVVDPAGVQVKRHASDAQASPENALGPREGVALYRDRRDRPAGSDRAAAGRDLCRRRGFSCASCIAGTAARSPTK
jgi:hypothetical protein